MEKKPTQSRKGVKGGFPLAGSRGSAPCGVWGNAPTVPRPTNSKEAANKSAGSEASLPVTLRVLRRAPKLLFRLLAHCRARWARPDSIGRNVSLGAVFACARRRTQKIPRQSFNQTCRGIPYTQNTNAKNAISPAYTATGARGRPRSGCACAYAGSSG